MQTAPALGPRVYRRMRQVGQAVLGDSDAVVRNGNWSGNDTCWRMALDLNRALLYGNPDGSWREAAVPKCYVAIVDGIVGGEGNGPLCPDPVMSGILFGGTNPAAVDAVAGRYMGFDPAELPIVAHAFAPHRWPIGRGPLDDIVVVDPAANRPLRLSEVQPAVAGGFRPHFGWQDVRRVA
jgi:hypothetical protein